MKRAFVIAAALIATTAWLGADLAEARRIGGGRSIGAQRQMTPSAAPTTPGAPSAAPTAPANPAMGAAAKAPAAGATAASGASRWLGPIAGLAAGLGLAALMSHLGLSEAFGSFLLLALLVFGGIFIVRMLLRRNAVPQRNPLQYAGNAPGRVEPVMGRGESRFEPMTAAAPAASSVTAVPANRFPAGFNPGPFIEQAKIQFRNLQAAYDRGDRAALAEVMTPEMFAEIAQEIAGRGSHTATEVIRLDAEILEATTEGRQHWLGVRFTGQLREDGAVLPKDFEEVWNLVKPVDDSSGWLLAGIQQTHAMA
ncbi:MAG: Tim44 domain-containing protein [Burkholderiales bacterium]|nr:Tim44 domain-containing protein [Burkholderiales bacterium]